MIPWMHWCRLCGNTQTALKVENSSEIENLVFRLFSVLEYLEIFKKVFRVNLVSSSFSV
jgi:hypothetical protein